MRQILKSSLGFALGLAALTSAAVGAGHSEKALKAAVDARHAQMSVVSYSTGILGDMAKGAQPYDAAVAVSAARNLNAMATLDRASLWIEGTAQGTIEGARAKPDVWSDPDGFAGKFKELETASAAMIDAAGTDLDALKAAMGGVGGACKACHEKYRGPKN